MCSDEHRTEMLVLGVGVFDQAQEQLGEVADDDEGRSECRAAVVLHNQVVPLKLPEDVRVALHYLKGVTGRRRVACHFYFTQQNRSVLFEDQNFPGPHLNIAMRRFKSNTLVTRRKITNNRMTSQLA